MGDYYKRYMQTGNTHTHTHTYTHISEVLKLWGASPGGPDVLVGGGVRFMREVFISNEIWAQDKMYILIGK
jgi:hypothetical protein